MSTSHELSAEDVMALMDGELADRPERVASTHIQSCATCQAVRRDIRDVSATLHEWHVEPAPDSFVAPPGSAHRPSVGPIATLALVAAACIAIFFFMSRLAGPASPQPAPAAGTQTAPRAFDSSAFAASWAQQPRIDLGLQIGGSARVLVVAFIDWLCVPCRDYSQAYEPVLTRYERAHPGAVKLIVRDWPWNTGCNPKVTTTPPGHAGSCVAALAVRIARDRGNADAMIAWLFEHVDSLSRLSEQDVSAAIKDALRRVVGAVDVDAAFAAARPALDREIAESARLDIKATPTYFINGVRATSDSQLAPEYLDTAIAFELKRTTGARGGG